jgi:excisionase family DNA binding protein
MQPAQNYPLTKAAYGVPEAVAVLSIGRTSLYELIKTGRLKATKCGRRTLFLAPDIAAFLSNLPPAGGL